MTQVVETKKLSRAEKLAARAEVLAKRIASDTEAYNEITAELDNAAKLSSVAEGSVVSVKLGRKFADKDTTRVVQATVLGVREDEDGAKQYKVTYGSGFEADVVVVGAASIVGVGAGVDFVTGEPLVG